MEMNQETLRKLAVPAAAGATAAGAALGVVFTKQGKKIQGAVSGLDVDGLTKRVGSALGNGKQEAASVASGSKPSRSGRLTRSDLDKRQKARAEARNQRRQSQKGRGGK
jgi:hypothetical protein